VVPAPLEIADPLVKFEFIRMPTAPVLAITPKRAGDSGQLSGQTAAMSTAVSERRSADCRGPRNLGLSEEAGRSGPWVEKDTLLVRWIGLVRVAVGTWVSNTRTLDPGRKGRVEVANFLLKNIPHVDARPGSANWCAIT